jgi:hypothetical protein
VQGFGEPLARERGKHLNRVMPLSLLSVLTKLADKL